MCQSNGVLVIGHSPLSGNFDVGEVDVSRRLVSTGSHLYYQIMDINGNHIMKYIYDVQIPKNVPIVVETPVFKNKNPELVEEEAEEPIEEETVEENKEEEPIQEDEKETPVQEDKEEEPIPCPHCMPDDKELRENTLENDLSLSPKSKLTTSWARIKGRR